MTASPNTQLTLKQVWSVFLFIGPSVGFLATVVLFVVVRSAGPDGLLAGVALGAMTFPLVYALGFLPMLVAGVGYWAVRRASAMFAVATSASALVGGLCGAIPVAFFFSFSGVEADVAEVWSYGIPGVAAALTCAMICHGKEAHVPDAVPSA